MVYELAIKAESLDELKRMVAEWANELAATPAPHDEGPSEMGARDADRLRKALREIHGADAKRFYLDVAEAVLRGEVVELDDDLLRRYGKTTGRSFSGVQAGAFRVIHRNVHRRVIVVERGGYAMSPEDAQIVVEVLGKNRR